MLKPSTHPAHTKTLNQDSVDQLLGELGGRPKLAKTYS